MMFLMGGGGNAIRTFYCILRRTESPLAGSLLTSLSRCDRMSDIKRRRLDQILNLITFNTISALVELRWQ